MIKDVSLQRPERLFLAVMPAGSQKFSGKGPPVPAIASCAGVSALRGESV